MANKAPQAGLTPLLPAAIIANEAAHHDNLHAPSHHRHVVEPARFDSSRSRHRRRRRVKMPVGDAIRRVSMVIM